MDVTGVAVGGIRMVMPSAAAGARFEAMSSIIAARSAATRWRRSSA
jgi:hypothetical protein